MQTCASLKEHMREVIDYVFCAFCMVCPGSDVSRNDQDCNRQSMLRQLGLVCVYMLRHKCSFPNSHFFILIVRNNKRSSGIDGKTSDCLSRICFILYYRYLELRFY